MDAAKDGARTRIVRALSEYWETLHVEGRVPRRAELDPSRIAPVLEHMFILEDVAHGPVRFRLTGSALSRLMGMELRGMPTRAIFCAADLSRIDDILRDALSQPASVDLTLEGPQGEGTMVLRPLADDFGAVTRLLGCIVMESDQPLRGTTFAIRSIRYAPLNESTRTQADPMRTGFAEEQAVFNPAPHLRAVKGRGRVRADDCRPVPDLRIVPDADD